MKTVCTALFAGMVALHLLSTASADLIVDFVTPGPVVLAPGVGTTTTSFDIRISNPGGPLEEIAGYSFFLDIGPVGAALPTGISFDSPAATYIAGAGVEPLVGAANPGTIELAPAAGNLGLGQLQLFNGTIDADESFSLLTVNLLVDRATASPGIFDLGFNAAGQNAIVKIGPSPDFESIPVDFTVVPGSIEFVAIPEPSSVLYLSVITFCMSKFCFWRKKMAALTSSTG